MKKIFSYLFLISFSFLFLGCPGSGSSSQFFTYLTWQNEDTSSRITINVLKMEPLSSKKNYWIHFDIASRQGVLTQYKNRALMQITRIPGLSASNFSIFKNDAEPIIARAEMTSLKPNTPYYFVISDDVRALGPEKKFKTLPEDASPVRFVVGGDMGSSKFKPLAIKAAARNPAVVLIGGDIAYDGGNLAKWERWVEWLETWESTMVSPDGFTIPMILAIGNHDCNSTNPGSIKDKAPGYFYLFDQAGEKTYFSRKIGKNSALFVLDSGHLTPYGGEQAQWLDTEMKKFSNFLYKFALYHVPLYPSRKGQDTEGLAKYRDIWIPIFDANHLTVAFEHHDHLFKRSKLLRGNKVVKPDGDLFTLGEGTLYLGDGRWGKGNHEMANPMPWYLEKVKDERHIWFADINSNNALLQGLSEEGLLDRVEVRNGQ